MIHLALDSLPDWAAGPALQTFAYVHLAPSLDQMARTYAQARAGLLPDEPILVVGQPTVFDPSRAPDGKHVLWVQVRMAPGTILGDAKGEIAATDWTAAAEPFAQRALQILERYAPGTGAKILASRVVTPNDLESDNPNLVGGDQVCGSHHLAQNFLFRPARGHADGSTPLKQLHLTGAAVWPGAGTGAGSGTMLAAKLAGKERIKKTKNETQPTGSTMKLSRRSLLQISAATVAAGAFGLPASAQAIEELVIAYNVNLPSWDPTVGPSAVNPTIQGIYQSVFDQYILQQPDLKPAPGLLTEWGWNDDKTQVWMTVREGVTWHDGSPFTAEDVAWSLARVANPETGSPIQFVWGTLANHRVEGNKVIADVTQFDPTIFKWMYFLTG